MKKEFYLSFIFMLMGIMSYGASVQRIEAEAFDESSGAQAETNASLSGGGNVGYVKDGTWIKFSDFEFEAFNTRFDVDANAYDGGNVEFRLDSVAGTLIANAVVASGTTYGTVVSADITSTSGTHDLYLIFTNASTGWLFNLDYFEVITELPSTLTDEAAAINWAFDLGTADQAATYIHDGFWKPESVSVAANLGYNGTETGQENSITFSKFTPGQKNNSVTADDVVSFNVTPATGLNFLPTNIAFNCERFGTGGGLIDVVWKDAAGVSTSIQTGIKPDRKGDDSYPDATYNVDVDVSALGIAASDGTGSLEIYIYAFDPGKNVGIANIKIDGLLNGTIVALPQYTVTIAANPAEGGAVESDEAAIVDEGTEVNLTASANFGYAFTEWVDMSGNSVSSDNPLAVTVMTDTSLTATFSTVETYTINASAMGGGNDYMITASPNENEWKYEMGDTITLSASENSILTFTEWSTGATEKSIDIIISNDVDITATYTTDGDIIAGWDFYKSGSADIHAPFASENNDTALLAMVNAAGTTSGWLDFSHDVKGDNDGWGNPKKYCAINWKGSDPAPTAENGYYFVVSFDASGFTDIQAQAEIAGTVDHFVLQNCDYSLDGTNWTTVGTFDCSEEDAWVQNKFNLGEDANNASIVYVRWIPDFTSTFSDHAWTNNGTSFREIYITGTAAPSTGSYSALKVTGNGPVIDGSIDQVWSEINMEQVQKVPQQDGANHPNITEPNPDPSDYSVEFGMLWNETGLYALISVTDDNVVIVDDYDTSNDVPADQWWTDDNINLLFSSDLLNASFNQWEFAWQPGIDQEEKLSSSDWLPGAVIDNDLVKSAWHKEGDVWTLETWISWDAFADFSGDITDGTDIFLEVRARDDDDTDAWESMYQWSTDNYRVENNGEGLGKVTLSATTIEGPTAKKVAYVQKEGFTPADGASAIDNDAVVKMLQADANFDLTVLLTDGNGTGLDLSGYDLVIAQETFGSGDGIWQSAGPLGIRNFAVPVIYNKNWALRGGKGITDADATITTSKALYISVDEDKQSDPLFSGISFGGGDILMFNELSSGATGNAIDVLNYLDLSDTTTLMASVAAVDDMNQGLVINQIPSGTQVGEDVADVLAVDMITFAFNYGAISKDDGANMSSNALTIWRNAAYILTGMTPPSSAYENDVYVPFIELSMVEAESFSDSKDARAETNDALSGGGNVGYVKDATWVSYSAVTFTGGEKRFDISAVGFGPELREIVLRKDAIDGDSIGVINIAQGFDFGDYSTHSAFITPPAGTYDLYLEFRGATDSYLFNIDYFKWFGDIVNATKTLSTTSIGVYPNPAINNVTITGVEPGAKISIYAANGQFIETAVATANKHSFNVNKLNTGVYILKVDMNGYTTVSKFIK